jgi:cytochrome c-type protein NapB
MRKFLLVVAVSAAAIGAAASGKAFSGKGLQTGKPGMNTYTDQTPGNTAPLPRPYPGAPPLIPHSVEGLSITRAANDCLGCHLEGMEVAEGHKATKMPASHFANPFTMEARIDRPVGICYNCLQCHAPQAVGAEPPVAQQRG